MAKATTDKKVRAPQGAKRVSQAFLDELGTIPEDKQIEVAKAAQAIVRDAMVARREKAKVAKAKLRAGKSAPASGKPPAKPTRAPAVKAKPRKKPVARRGASPKPAPTDGQGSAEDADGS